MKQAVVTGASGYIGSHLVRALLQENWQVSVILRENSKATALQGCWDDVEVFRHDGTMSSMMAFFEHIGPVNMVFHLASFFTGEHSGEQIEALMNSNITFGTMLAEAMTAVGCRYIINTGTAWQHFQQEDYNPVGLYAATKEAFEDVLTYYVEARGLNCLTLELFDTYGENDPRRKVINLLRDCWHKGDVLEMSGGEQQMDLVYIDDVVRAFLTAAEVITRVPGQHKYTVATQKPSTLRAIVGLIAEITGGQLKVNFGERPYRPREMMTTWQGGTILPGWEAQVDLRSGLEKVFKAQP